MTLRTQQRAMRAWLTQADDAGFAPGAAPGLAVYQNNYRSALMACIETSFPCTRDWIGGAAFAAAAAAYIDAVPPSSWTLDAYPRDLPAMLAARYPGDAEIGELAWLEWALGEAFVAPDAVPLAADALREVDWDRAVLRLSPTVDLAPLTTNAPAIWSALAAGETPPAAAPLPEPGALLVWRLGGQPCFRAIDAEEQAALVAARAGTGFAALCEAAVVRRGEGEGVARAGAMLGQWIADGLIVGID